MNRGRKGRDFNNKSDWDYYYEYVYTPYIPNRGPEYYGRDFDDRDVYNTDYYGRNYDYNRNYFAATTTIIAEIPPTMALPITAIPNLDASPVTVPATTAVRMSASRMTSTTA